MAASPRERQRGALAGTPQSGRQRAHPRLPGSRNRRARDAGGYGGRSVDGRDGHFSGRQGTGTTAARALLFGRALLLAQDEPRATTQQHVLLIARVLGIDANTLRKHFRDVLDTSADKADAQVAASLFKMAISGKSAAAAIFWMKARRGWSETNRLEHTGPGGAALPIDAARALLRNVAKSRPPEDPDETPLTA